MFCIRTGDVLMKWDHSTSGHQKSPSSLVSQDELGPKFIKSLFAFSSRVHELFIYDSPSSL